MSEHMWNISEDGHFILDVIYIDRKSICLLLIHFDLFTFMLPRIHAALNKVIPLFKFAYHGEKLCTKNKCARSYVIETGLAVFIFLVLQRCGLIRNGLSG